MSAQDMHLDNSHLPMPIAAVARRVNVTGLDRGANSFLALSYLAETVLKYLGISLIAAVNDRVPELGYRWIHYLIQSDGLGDWERVINETTRAPAVGYLPPEYQEVIVWLTKKRTKQDDRPYREAHEALRSIFQAIGPSEPVASPKITVRDILVSFIQIRNKTKAHGALGEEHYKLISYDFYNTLSVLLTTCPIANWTLLRRQSDEDGSDILELNGPEPILNKRLSRQYDFRQDGLHIIPCSSFRPYILPDLIQSAPECTDFYFCNGGLTNSGQAEYVSYATGQTKYIDVSMYTRAPVALPPSETEGLEALDVQSNVFGNLPALPEDYVRRHTLETELLRRLRDKNHPVITLHGPGGMGKTSLALFAAHTLSEEHNPTFEQILWFSARDIDLRPTGPKQVRQKIVNLSTVYEHMSRLFGIEPNEESFALHLEYTLPGSEQGTLYIFDNFETLADTKEIHEFLDAHTHLPNKVLITSRERAFKADFPIEVMGMEADEAAEVVRRTARSLKIEGLVDDAMTDKIIEYTSGHAYLIKVVVGEIAKDGRFVPPSQFVTRREDIVDAIFERSFNKLSQCGRLVFLLVSNWRSLVPEIALQVIVGQRGYEPIEGIEECRRLSLIVEQAARGDMYFYTVPQVARLYGQKKLKGDPDRMMIEEDLNTLRTFGARTFENTQKHERDKALEIFIDRFYSRAHNADEAGIKKIDKLLQGMAEIWPRAWLKLGEFRERFEFNREDIEYAYRRAVEEMPFNKESWNKRADFAYRMGDDFMEISALIQLVEIDPEDKNLLSEAAFKLTNYVSAKKAEIPETRRGVYIASVREHMTRVAERLDATALSRLAWLYLLEGDKESAKKFALRGFQKNKRNKHCANLLNRLRAN